MTKHTDYINIEDAQDVSYVPGQYWEFAPGVTVEADEYDDEGNIVRTWELTEHAAVIELEQITEGTYRMYGNQYGDKFSGIEANIDGDTLIRLVDAR